MFSKSNRNALVGWVLPVCTTIWSLEAVYHPHPYEEFKLDFKVCMCIKSHVHIYYGSKSSLPQQTRIATQSTLNLKGEVIND